MSALNIFFSFVYDFIFRISIYSLQKKLLQSTNKKTRKEIKKEQVQNGGKIYLSLFLKPAA